MSRAVLELVLAGVIWGFGFVVTRWGLDSLPPTWLHASRFLLASALALPFVWRSKAATKQTFRLAMLPGITLSCAILVQTIGLKYTTVAKSSFLTTLYVLLVPIIERFYLKRKLSGLFYGCVTLAVGGTFVMCGGFAVLDFNFGDLLSLLCAVLAAFQIIQIEIIQPRIESAFVFNTFQAVWAGITPLLFAIVFEGFPPPAPTLKGLFAIFYLATFSALIAFLIQVRTQKLLPPSLVSLLFLLESPFALFFGWVCLQETVTLWQGAGCLLILLASSIAGFSQVKK